jgi:signal transduction histidine kinase
MRRLSLLAVPAGIGLGLLAEWAQFGWRQPDRWVPDLLVGWTFLMCGLIAGWSRRGVGSGALLGAAGVAWFVPNFAGAAAGILARVLSTCLFLHRGPLVHLLVAYPDAKARAWLWRAVIAAGYVVAVVFPAWGDRRTAIVLALALAGVVTLRYRRSVGRDRLARRAAVWAGVGLGVLLAGESIVRLCVRSVTVNATLLAVYELILAAMAVGLTVDLITTPWERVTITDLVVELGDTRSGTLQDELARALGDPSLEVGYWIPERARFVDHRGHELLVPDPASHRSATMVERDRHAVAILVHDPAVLADAGLIEAVSSAARLGAANARLQADVRARQDEIRASRERIVEAADEERRRLQRRLHEGPESRLERISELLSSAKEVTATGPGESIAKAEAQLSKIRDDLRRLALGLHPGGLSERSLAEALASLVADASLATELEVLAHGVPPSIAACVYFVCAEAIANASKHASADLVRISVVAGEDRVTVEIEDDGVGGADPARGTGLRGLRDRIEALGGTLSVQSSEGRGTRLAAVIPMRVP